MTFFTIAVLPTFYFGHIGFNYHKTSDLFEFGLMFILMIIFGLIFYSIIKHVPKQKEKHRDDYYKPILLLLIFISAYILAIKSNSINMPWFIGYILVTISFIIGLVIYRKDLIFGKTTGNV